MKHSFYSRNVTYW